VPQIGFPNAPFKPAKLADWLELQAILSPDKTASAGALERELNRLGRSGVQAESLIGNVFTEIDGRKQATGDLAYPFSREPSSIKVNGNARDYPAYVFCLALSFCSWKVRKGARETPWLLFEQLAAHSARGYLGGQVEIFGTSTREGSPSKKRFADKVNRLVSNLGEGDGFKTQRTFSTKDAKLDIVAWKPFPDARASQVILFGQCAGGANWTSKLTELDPDVFWDQWIVGGKVSHLLRSVFIPHRVFDTDEWEKHARAARLLFDRCRIAASAHDLMRQDPLATKLLRCCRKEWNITI
jgi:hypothetical protein